MARKPEEEANHWPGFVDALSTIVMVITFLLILLGLTLFIMMQKIKADANVVVDTQIESEAAGGSNALNQEETQAAPEQATASASQTSQVAELKEKLEQAQKEIEKLKTQTKQTAGAPKAPEGQSIASMGAELRQEEQIETEDKLTIITRKTDDKLKVAVAADEEVTQEGSIKVTSASVALELDFEEGARELDEPSANMVKVFLDEKNRQFSDGVYEVRSIASSKAGSVSEARRRAYFRALIVRNMLLDRGIPPSRIQTKIAQPQPGEADNKVLVSLKPAAG